MKLPKEIYQVTLKEDRYWTGIFPPLGYIEFEEGNDGGGDYYGLYWQWGKEQQEPIVCQLRHEEALLVPAYPDLNAFLASDQQLGKQFFDEKGLDNKTFFLMPFQKAKVLARNGQVSQAIERLQISVELFAEYSDSWTLLSEQLRKQGNILQAQQAALQAIKSNWAFGLPSQKAIAQFEVIDENGPLSGDPLVKRKAGLLTGGTYNNPFKVDVEQLLACIEAYKDVNDVLSAMLLEQNYGYWMYLQDEQTKIKFGFETEKWRQAFVKRCFAVLPNRRISIEKY